MEQQGGVRQQPNMCSDKCPLRIEIQSYLARDAHEWKARGAVGKIARGKTVVPLQKKKRGIPNFIVMLFI